MGIRERERNRSYRKLGVIVSRPLLSGPAMADPARALPEIRAMTFGIVPPDARRGSDPPYLAATDRRLRIRLPQRRIAYCGASVRVP